MKRENFDVKYIFDLLRSGKKNEGIELLYTHHYNKMYGIAFSFVKKEDVSQDIVHNVAYKILKLDSDKFPTKYELSWLYTVVKNETMSFFRNTKPTISIDDVELSLFQEVQIDEFVDMDEYYSMISNLNEKQKEIVTLKVLGGYTHKEISEMLGKPIGTIQWIFNTAIKKLKRSLISLIGVMILAISGIVASTMQYFAHLNVSESPGGAGHSEQLLNQCLVSMVVFSVILLICLVSFLLIYFYSDKLPTKKSRKTI